MLKRALSAPLHKVTSKPMKTNKILLSALSAIAIAAPAYAVDPVEPGKTSDSTRQPASATSAPSTSAAGSSAVGKSPGKESDGIREDVTARTADAAANKYHGKITAINKSEKTVTIEDKKMGKHMLHIDDTTKFMKGSDKAAWSDLNVGDEIQGTCEKMEGEKFHAISAKLE